MIPMDSNTCSKRDCPNWGTLIIDANIVIYVLAASIAVVRENSAHPTWPLRLPEVLTVFEENLQKMKRCSHNGKLYISEPILNEELNTEDLKLGACPTGQSQSVYNTSELENIHQVVCNCFHTPIITMSTEITELRHILSSQSTHLDDNDSSLLLAAYKVGQSGIPTLVISQDGQFEDPVLTLAGMRNCTIQGKSYETHHTIWRTYLGFILTAHDCCLYSSGIFEKLYNSWCFTIPKRIARAKRQQLATRLQEQFIFTLPVMQKSIEYKNRQAS